MKVACPLCSEAAVISKKGIWCESCKNGSKYQEELESTVRCFMNYIMELHDFQMGARKIAYQDKEK